MPHPLVAQLQFARSEFQRGLEGVTEEEACRRFLPMNCISWNVGHLAWQEQRYWLTHMQSRILIPALNELVAYGRPATTPPLGEMWSAWETVTRAADEYLDGLTTQGLQEPYIYDGKPAAFAIGSRLLRVIYHYWYHNGENLAIRQLLGHTDLPEFVGDIEELAPYRPE
ncbi:MAG: DinB family protein [Rudaea sp.]